MEEAINEEAGTEESEIGPEDRRVIEERKKKIIGFFKKTNLWIIGLFIVVLILGIYIRSLPMLDHGGRPGLWDITTNTWTLGPDLDPFLFMRQAGAIVENGSMPGVDMMRNVPVGFKYAKETVLLPWMIAVVYWIVNIFSEVNVEFAAAVFPVIMFALTILVFFLFVREIFLREDKKSRKKADIIALISTLFMIVMPVFLSRTIAGIPEKESAAFFFMFLSFYLFLKAWKAGNMKKAVIFGVLAGISTVLMGLIWGGVSYIFITITVASLFAFILDKFHKKELIVYLLWVLSYTSLLPLLSDRFTFISILTSLGTSSSFFVLFVYAIHAILWKTKLSNIRFLKESKIPRTLISFVVSLIFVIVVTMLFLGPSFILEKVKAVHQTMFRPVTGRWSVTVAENRQPYFVEWVSSFGPYLRNIPVFFWLFFAGSIVLFKKILREIKKKDAWILTGLYVLFFFGLVFSRYAPHPSMFDGENFISKFIYYFSALLLVAALAYYHSRYHREGNQGFNNISFEFLFLFSLFFLTLFTARSAVRLIMVLAPVAPIFVAYLIVKSTDDFIKTEDKNKKIILGLIALAVVLLSVYCFIGIPFSQQSPGFYQSVKAQAYASIPSSYTQQWQKAMAWVRDNTAENAVFAHWWDYGYWVQTMGKRATVVDGGNEIVYWNYLMGRLVLTGDNQKDALEFLYNHNSTHLLIDSTDIGKYTAYSSIGSNKDYDRYSWVPVMVSDSSQIQETSNGVRRAYRGGFGLDEDFVYEETGEEIFLPSQSAGIAGILLEIPNENPNSFEQPEAVVQYQGQQRKIPIRYVYYNSKIIDFGTGLDSTIYVTQRIEQTERGINIDDKGALIYISPRVMRGLFAQIYLLNDPFNKFPNFKLVYSEDSSVVASLKSQGAPINEFVYFSGIRGPIKIWEISYKGDEKIRKEYLDIDPSKYIDWEL